MTVISISLYITPIPCWTARLLPLDQRMSIPTSCLDMLSWALNIFQINGQFSRVLSAGWLSIDKGKHFHFTVKLWQHGKLYHPYNDTTCVHWFTINSHLTGYRYGLRVEGRRYNKKVHTMPHFFKTSSTYSFITLGILDIQNKSSPLKIEP